MPKHNLEAVKSLCRRGAGGVTFTARTKSLDCIVTVLKCEPDEAVEACLQGILLLQPRDFSHRLMQWNDVDCIADVYGLEDYEGNNWYVKFLLYEEDGETRLEEISFHLPVKDLPLKDGRTLPGRGRIK